MATDYYKMGLGLGGAYFDGQEDGRLRKRQMDKDARETTEYDQRQAEYTRAQGLQRKSDAAYDNLDSVSSGVVDPGATGLSQPSAQMLSQGYGGAKGPQAVQDAAGDYTREANRMGMAPQGYNAQAPVTQRKASDREMLDAEMGVATATRDRGYRESLQAKGKELDWNDGRLTHGKAWDAMTDEQKRAKTDEFSQNAGIPGSGTWVAGEGKRAGYMWYTPPGKDPVQLSGKEAKELFTLANLAAVNPERARKETETAGDKVRAVYGHLFEVQTKGVTANNTGQHYLDNAEHQRGTLAETTRTHKVQEGLRGQEVGISRDRANREKDPKRGAPIQMIDAQGSAALMQPVQGADGKLTYEPVSLPQGMRFPKQVDPAAIERRAAALEGKPMPGLGADGRPQVYNADTAYNAARSQLYGQDGGGSATDRAIAKAQGGGNTEQTGTKPQVPGRPLYNADMRSLEAMARKPRGISSAEANDAAAELEARKGESRIQGF